MESKTYRDYFQCGFNYGLWIDHVNIIKLLINNIYGEGNY